MGENLPCRYDLIRLFYETITNCMNRSSFYFKYQGRTRRRIYPASPGRVSQLCTIRDDLQRYEQSAVNNGRPGRSEA